MNTFIRISFFILLITLEVYAQRIPDDLDLSKQWALDKINVTKAWDITTGSPDVLIAVFDTGIPMQNGTLSHYDLDDQNKFILGNDYTNTSLTDQVYHGTHVTGIIGAEVNNPTDGDPNMAGVVWNCKLLIFKMSNGDFVVDKFEDAVKDAVAMANNLNCKLVISITSASISDEDDEWKHGLDWARSHNALVVASVGNRSGDVEYPAKYSSSYNNVIAVSATNNNDEFAELYSNHGPEVNVAAPGGEEVDADFTNIENIYSTLPDYFVVSPYYGYDGGTSMAAPHVAGVAGLILSLNRNLTPLQVRSILETTANDKGTPGKDDYYGHGRINAYEALKYTLENYGGTLSGDVTLIEDLTIANNKVLTVVPGTTVKFANGKKLIVHGRIVANGATFQPVSGTWKGIFIDGQTASSFDNCYITGIKSDACGLTFSDSYNTTHQVSDCYIEGGKAAIWIKSSSDPVISNSYLRGTGSQNVVLSENNSDGKINDCKLYAENYQVIRGHYNMNSATPCYGDAWKYNIIDGKKFITEGSSIYVSGGYPYFNYGYNSILSDDYLYQYSNYSGSTREAKYNYWGGGAPVVRGNTVNYSGYLTSPHANAGPDWTLSKSTGDELIVESNPLADAWKEYFNRNTTNAKQMAKELFAGKNSEEESSEMLFLWMKSALREGTLKEEESNLLLLNSNKSINESAQYEALRWLAKLAVREGDIKKAEDYALSIPKTSLMGREILFDVADEIMENWGDLEKASSILNEITERYTDDETLKEKQFVLSLYTDNIYAYSRSNNNKPQAVENQDNAINLSEAYPNPFNPTTIISYSIPEDGMVTLKVYDILGREVAELVNEEKPAGTYKVNFNGDRLSSGIYFYSLQTNGKIVTKKMLLIK